MKVGKIWQQKEDQILQKLVNANLQQRLDSNPKWSIISKQFNQRFENKQKTPKQCRQRWHNRLNPKIQHNNDWTEKQEQILFQLHDKQGNKWAEFAKKLVGRTDNSIKNHFYSTIRRGLRRINQYIVQIKRKLGSFKQFKPQLLNKIIAVADGNTHNKLDIKDVQIASDLAFIIKKQLIQISKLSPNEFYHQSQSQSLIKNLQQFSRVCKKKKGTKNFQNYQSIFKKQQKQVIIDKIEPKQNLYKNNIIKLPSSALPSIASNFETYQNKPQSKLISKISMGEKSLDTACGSSIQMINKNESFNSSFLNNIQQITVDKKNLQKQQKREQELQFPPMIIQIPYQNIFQSQTFSHLIQSRDLFRYADSIRYGLLSDSINFGGMEKSHPDIAVDYKENPKSN